MRKKSQAKTSNMFTEELFTTLNMFDQNYDFFF